jgi:hypothetical protein
MRRWAEGGQKGSEFRVQSSGVRGQGGGSAHLTYRLRQSLNQRPFQQQSIPAVTVAAQKRAKTERNAGKISQLGKRSTTHNNNNNNTKHKAWVMATYLAFANLFKLDDCS